MIAQLTGTVVRAAGTLLVLEVHGVGYRLNVPVTVVEGLPKAGGPVTLVTHMQVREDDISLFGFLEDMDLRVFELLLTVSGVGPKVALALLSALPSEDLARAVSEEDVKTLTRVPGVGLKTAQRMVLELNKKFTELGFEHRMSLLSPPGKPKLKEPPTLAEDIATMLENLGYTNKADVKKAVEFALQQVEDKSAPGAEAALFRQALNRLTRP